MSEQAKNEAGNEGGSVTVALPEQCKEGEGMTEFTMRRIRNEHIEECAKAAEAQKQTFLDPRYASNQPFGSICERFACEEVAKAIRGLKR
jgi:hypothetical protein